MALKQELALFKAGYDMGIGVAMATGRPMALGATGEVTPLQAVGAPKPFRFFRIDTTEDLQTKLGISADVSGGIGLFSPSASFDLSRVCKVRSTSLCVMVVAEVQFAFQQMDSPALSPAAARLVENGDLERFAEQFGEYFVRGMQTGGRFFGVMRLDTRSAQSKTDVDSALSRSYGAIIDADVRVHISETLQKAEAELEIFILHEGGETKTPPTSVNQLFKAMDEWTATVWSQPMPYVVTLAPYRIALGPDPPNFVELERQRDVLIGCAKLRAQKQDQLNLVDHILDRKHTGEFEIIPPPDGPNLPGLQAAFARDLNIIADAASFSIDNIKQACDPETFMREIKHEPNFTFTTLPPNMPKHTGLRMLDLAGELSMPVVGLFACINLTEPDLAVNHCLEFVKDELKLLKRVDPRRLAEFFFFANRNGIQVQFRGDPNPPLTTIREQFPPADTLLTRGAIVTLNHSNG